MDDTAIRLGIHELIGDYAERIDEDRLEEWPDLFTDPCRYLIISRANHAAGMRQGVIYAASRGMLLDSSLSAPRRSSNTLSGEPVFTSAAMKPFASASIPTNTATTSPMPSAVSSVETGRCDTLRTL